MLLRHMLRDYLDRYPQLTAVRLGWPKWSWVQSRLAVVRLPERLDKSYWAVSSAPVDALWQTMVNLADVSWHPLLTSTNAPQGLMPKPGLIYRAFTRLLPVPISIFVERVLPQELVSIRVFPVPGLEERVTYQIRSTVAGTEIAYSITLRGWLSPLAWSLLKPYAARVAAALAEAAEQTAALGASQSRYKAW